MSMKYFDTVSEIYEWHIADLNDWERDFIQEMFDNLQDDDELSKWQKNKIEEIYSKYC